MCVNYTVFLSFPPQIYIFSSAFFHFIIGADNEKADASARFLVKEPLI